MNKQKLIKKVEKRILRCILSDIHFGYTRKMIKYKIKNGGYIGNLLKTFK